MLTTFSKYLVNYTGTIKYSEPTGMKKFLNFYPLFIRRKRQFSSPESRFSLLKSLPETF